MMGMDHAGHVCCWGGMQGVLGGLHLLRRQRDRKRAIWSGLELIGPLT